MLGTLQSGSQRVGSCGISGSTSRTRALHTTSTQLSWRQQSHAGRFSSVAAARSAIRRSMSFARLLPPSPNEQSSSFPDPSRPPTLRLSGSRPPAIRSSRSCVGMKRRSTGSERFNASPNFARISFRVSRTILRSFGQDGETQTAASSRCCARTKNERRALSARTAPSTGAFHRSPVVLASCFASQARLRQHPDRSALPISPERLRPKLGSATDFGPSRGRRCS